MASSRERFNNIIASENTRRVNARERYEALRVLERADEELNSAVNFINSGKGNITSGDANADGGTDIRDIVRSKKISAESTEHIDAVNKLRSAYDVLERYAKQQGGGLEGYKEMANGLNEIKEILVGTKQVGEENAKLLADMISGAYAKRLYREQTEQMFENIDLNSPEIFAKQQQYKQNNPNLYSVMGGRAYNPIPSVNPTQLTKEDLEKVQTAQAADAKYRDPILRQELKDKMDAAKSMYDDFYKGENDLQTFLNKIGGVGGGEEAREKYKKKYEDAAADYYSLTVGNEEMRKQRISELEREVGILQIKMRENPQSKKSLESQLDEVRAELNGLRTSLYGKVTIGEYVGAHALAGADSVSTGVYNTLGLIIGKPLEWIGWKDNPVLKLKEFTQKNHERLQNEALLASRAMGDDYNVGGMLIQGVVAAIPDAALAFATAGTSKAVQLGTKAPGFFAALSRTATNMAKNPMFWSSYVRTLGNDYDSAIEDGASPEAAFIYAQLTSTLNAVVEIGGETGHGGIQTLPDALKNAGKNKSAILEWVTSSLDEGKEEVIQSVISDLNARIIYNSDKKPDIGELAKEGAMGIAVGGILGGGQISANMILNADTRAEYKQIGEVALRQEDFEGIISYARKSVDTDIRALALSSTPQNISAENAGLLYSYVYKDITAAIASPAESATARQNFIDIMRENDSATVQALAGSRYIIRMSEDPQIGEMPTIDNINTESVIDNGENSELQSTANGGIIENRGDNYVLSDTRTDFTSNKQSAQSDSRGESQNGRIFAEDEVTFQRRVQETISGNGRGHSVKYGNTTFAYVERTADSNSNYGRAAQLLKSAGVKVVVCEGAMQRNDGKTTTQSTEAVTAEDGTVYISDRATLPAEEIAAHELVHVAQRTKESVYIEFEDVICDNIDYSSDAYIDLAGKINTNNFGGKYDIDDIASAPKIMRELSAYINQYVATDPEFAEQTFGKMFKDWGAVVEASKKFNKDMGATSAEAASSFAQNESVFDEPSAQFPKADFLEDMGAKLAGVERHSEGQRKIIEIGRKLGYRVVFDRDLKTRSGAFANGKIDRKNKVIYINPNSTKAMQFIFKHELTHYLELNFSAYTDFANAVMDSALFKRYVTSRGYKSTAEWNSAIVGEYAEAGFKDFGEADANYEMVADFVGDCLFGKSESLSEQLLKCVPENQRKGFFEKVKEFFAKIRQLFAGNKNVSSEITELEKQFIKAYKAVETNKNTAENGGEKYSVEFQSAIVNTNIKNMIDKIKSGEFKANEKIYFDDIDEEIAQQIEILTGIDVSGFKMAIEARQLEHILKDHGENGKADSSLSDVDNVAKMEYALKSPDDIRLSGKTQAYSYMKDGKNRTADTVLYEKAIGDKSYYVVQAVADTKAKTLYVVTAFIGKSGYKKEAPQLIDAQSPNVTSKDGSAIASNNSISQKDTSVNTYSTQEDESYSIPVLEREEFAPKNSVATSDGTDDLLDRYDRGEISREELISGLTSQKKKAKENPKTIADMTPADASTTPALERRKGESRGDKESKFYESLLKSDIFDDRFKAEVESDTFIQKYESVTNKATLAKAARELDEGGRAYVASWWALSAERASLMDAAVGFILMDRYQRVGDYISAIAVAEKVRAFGTAGGQEIQLFSIVGRLDPNAMTAYAQKTLNDAYEIMIKGKSQRWLNENVERFKLTEEDIEFIRRRTLQAALLPEGRDKAIKLAEICQRVQDKLPPSKGQSIRALQRISLLLNPRTIKRNILGNGSMVPVFIASDWFGAAIDKAVSKKTEVRTTGTFKLKGSGTALKKGLYESWDDFKRGIRTRQEELDRFDVNSGGKNFNEHHAGKFAKQLNAVAKKLNDIDRFTSFCLEAGDRPFFEMWMNNSLNNQLRLNNIEVPTPEMLDIARTEALQRTWQDNNSATKAVSGMKRALNLAHIKGTDYGLGDIAIKYVKTPTNIGKAMVEFSPVGLVFAGANAKALKNAIETGQFTPQMQKEFVRSMSNAITGTLLYVLVFSAASAGLIALTGAGDDDDDVSNFERYVAGIPPYSIELFGTHVTYDWMQPFGAVLATVADFMESRRNDPEGGIGADFIQAIKAGGRVFSEQSFMKSLYDLFSGEDFIDCITAAILSEPAAFIPQFSSQIASFLDKDRRTTYDPQNEFKTAFNKVIARIPGLRKELPEQVNVLGETAENTQYLDPWEAFLAPGNTYPKSSGKVADEVYELYKKTGNKKVIPRVAPKYFSVKGNKIIFTAEEKADFQRRIGGLSSEMLSAFFSSSQYNSLSDETKVDVIEEIYSYALAKAKSEREYDYKLLSAMKGERKNGEPLLTKEMYERLNKEARSYIAEEYFLSNAEMRYSKNTERLIEYYINQAKK